MTKWSFDRSLGVLIVLCTMCLSACVLNWTIEDMTPKDLKYDDDGKKLEVRLDGQPANPGCSTDECFDLYYFKGRNFNTNDTSRKNVLFIVGGPGQIPLRKPGRELSSFLETNHNVVYFDLRGSGFSQIKLPNTYDKYLRAKFVVGDIEQLRNEVLGNNGKWDAIFGFSYGTVIAQQYAYAHPTMVERLILVGSIDRRDDTDKARKKMVFDNLDNIYKLIRSKDPNICDCITKPPLKVSFIPYPIPATFPTHNFCFLKPESIETIRNKLDPIYDKLEAAYGSVNIVTQNLDELMRDATFQKDFPYPGEFFRALRQLQLWGMPSEKEDSIFFEEQIHSLFSAAIVVGYYVMLDENQLRGLQKANFSACHIDSPFFKDVGNAPVCKGDNGYCKRLDQLPDELKPESPESVSLSLRVFYVFGVYDGIYRWSFRIMDNKVNKDTACLKGEDIEDFAWGGEEQYKILRKLTRKIGNVSDEEVCPWNPAKFKHGVQSLILKGGADPVIAGCQAENFFNDGLSEGKRVLIEFPAMGHSPIIRFKQPPPDSTETDQGKAYREMVEKFLKLSVDEFENEVSDELEILKAKDRTPQQGMRVPCPAENPR